jgi:alpha-mannosidase
LLAAGQSRTLCQTVYFDGQEHRLDQVRIEPLAAGPVFARLRITGVTTGLTVENLVTVYAELDRVDFELRVTKQPSANQERLCQVFPLLGRDTTLRAASSGAVVRPRPQPAGDLLPGADAKRFAVQEFVDVATADFSVTLVPHDAFALRLDLDTLAFEALGNDQNYREVLRDQDGQTQFRFRYSLRASARGYRASEAIAFARSAAAPLGWKAGRLAGPGAYLPRIEIDSARAIATCLKPTDDPQVDGLFLRLWETAGQPGPLRIGVAGFSQAVAADLLERDRSPLAIRDGAVEVDLKPHGYAALRLVR